MSKKADQNKMRLKATRKATKIQQYTGTKIQQEKLKKAALKRRLTKNNTEEVP